MKCCRCPDVCSGHLLGVYLSIFTWVGENLVCLYHIYSHKTQFPQNWKKRILSGKKLIKKMALFFAIWRNYGTRYLILGEPYFFGDEIVLFIRTNNGYITAMYRRAVANPLGLLDSFLLRKWQIRSSTSHWLANAINNRLCVIMSKETSINEMRRE